MRRLLGFAAGLLALSACSDIISPPRLEPYEYRTFAESGDSLLPLAFHWPRRMMPVQIYIADGDALRPALLRAIDMWQQLFLYGEFRAELTTDPSAADIVVQNARPSDKLVAAFRLESMAPQCSGETTFVADAVAGTLQLPFEIYVWAKFPNDPALENCYQLTVLHELGHAIGIFAHSPNPDDLMAVDPFLNGISERDRAAAEAAAHFPATLVPVGP